MFADDAVNVMQKAHIDGLACVISCSQEDAETYCEGGLRSTSYAQPNTLDCVALHGSVGFTVLQPTGLPVLCSTGSTVFHTLYIVW